MTLSKPSNSMEGRQSFLNFLSSYRKLTMNL